MNDEQVVFRGSPSLLTKFGPLFLATLVIAAGITGVYMLNNLWLWIIPALALVHIIVVVLLVRSVVYEVTNERLRFRRGIITKRTDELELYRVKDTTLIEPLMLRLFGRGHIEIATFDPTTPTLLLEAVKDARGLRENLRRFVEECRDRKGVRVAEFDGGQAP